MKALRTLNKDKAVFVTEIFMTDETLHV